MSTLTVTAKGQVTLRKDFLAHLGVKPGDQIAVQKLPGGRIEVRAERAGGSITDYFGALKCEGGPSLTLNEIKEIIEQGWARET